MNKWSPRSSIALATCHPELRLLFDRVLQIYDCSILKGHRDMGEQNAAFFSVPQRSKLQWPDGNHNALPSNAVDAKPYILGVEIRGDRASDLKYFYAFAYVVITVAHMLYEQGLMKHKVRWGGDWDSDKNLNDQEFNDLYHFELIVV